MSYTRLYYTFGILILFCWVGGGTAVYAQTNTPTPYTQLTNALQQAQTNAHYQFNTQFMQTETFAPTVGNIGRPDHSKRLQVTGAVNNANNNLQMTFSSKEAGNQYDTTIKVENGLLYEQKPDGAWSLYAQQDLNFFSATGDPLTFLDIAKNVSHATEADALFPTEMLPPAQTNLTRLTFDIDTQAFKTIMQQQMQAQLQAQNQWRAGMSLNMDQLYGQMNGKGELWLNNEGYPSQQIVRIIMPTPEGNTVTVHMTTQFTDWAETMLSSTQRLQKQLTVSPQQAIQTSTELSFFLLLCFLVVLYISHSQSRRLYIGLTVVLIASFILTPFLQAVQADEVQHAMARLTNQKEPTQEAQTPDIQLQEALAPDSFNPKQNPLLGTQEQVHPTTSQSLFMLNQPNFTTGQDTDGDGLNDEVEIYKLGTNPNNVDTDGDNISDLNEVTGFLLNGQMWYLNPLNPDSNGDGTPDNTECLPRVNVDKDGLLIAGLTAGACPDTDGDHVPNIFDYDNDADGVPDSVDTSPLYTGALTSQSRETFSLNLSGYQTNTPLELTIDLRPTDESHLYLTNNVYDWPAADREGQVTRVFTNTLADMGFSGNDAHNGDMMLVPMLQVDIPWNSNNPSRGLPISATVPIAMGTPINQWLDQGLLKEYGIQATQNITTGLIVLTSPLSEVQDSVGDRLVAWRAKVPYFMKTAVWGNNHQIRLAWTVIGLQDTCNTSTKPANVTTSQHCTNTANWQTSTTIHHRYYEPFHVTGISVLEDHGMNTAIFAETNALSMPYERNLWRLADVLQETYMSPHLMPDNSRFDLSQIVSRFAVGSSATATERWGIANDSFTIQTNTYANTMLGANALVETDVQTFLNNTFSSAVISDTTTALFIYEQTNRSTVLSNGTPEVAGFNASTGIFTATLQTAYSQTIATMNWRPFVRQANMWDAQPLDAYTQDLQTNISPLLTDQELNNIAGNGLTNYPASRAGALNFIANFYLTIYVGNAMVVEMAGRPLAFTPLVDANHQLTYSTEPAFELTALILKDILLLAQASHSVNLDNTVIQLSAYQPIANTAQLLQEFGVLVQAQQATTYKKVPTVPRSFVIASLTEIIKEVRGIVRGSDPLSKDLQRQFVIPILLIGTLAAITSIVLSSVQDEQVSQFAKPADIIAKTMFGAAALITIVRSFMLVTYINTQIRQLNYFTVLSEIGYGRYILLETTQTVTNIGRAIKVAAIVGLVISVIVEIVMFILTVILNKLEAGSPAFNRALSLAISGIAIALFIFALTVAIVALSLATAGIFLVVLVLLFVLEFAFGLACKIGNFSPDHFTCQGIMSKATRELAKIIYKYELPVDFDKDGRIALDITQAALVDEIQGYQVGNQLDVTMSVVHNQFPKPPTGAYAIQGKIDTYVDELPPYVLQRSSYAYYLQETAVQPPNNLHLDLQTWTQHGSMPNYRLEQTFTPVGRTTFTSAGINQPISFYLIEQGAVPALSCWLAIAVYTCEQKMEKFGSSNQLSSILQFDIFPATLSQFAQLTGTGNNSVRQAWDSRFPVLVDGDGDGLRSKLANGSDPFDGSVDTDGDGLTDHWEQANNFNPLLADGDNDNLIDYWEVFYRTNPYLADTDADGLLDGEEVFHPASYAGDPTNNAASWSGGWSVVYQYDNGGAQITAVSANPRLPDTDLDGNSDKYESIYKFNPNAPYSIDPISIKSLDLQASNDYDYIVEAGQTFNYNVELKSNLDTILQSRGLLEAEFPEDSVQQTQVFTLTGQDSLTMTGSLWVNPDLFPTTTATNMTIRGGAYTNDTIPTPSNLYKQVLPLDRVRNDLGGYLMDVSRNVNGGRCIPQGGGVNLCPNFSQEYANFAIDDQIWGSYPLSDPLLAPFTISMWLLPSQAFATDRALFTAESNYYLDPNVFDAKVAANGKTVYVDFNSGSTCANASIIRATASTDLIWNQWNQFVIRYDGSQATISVNGQTNAPVNVPSLCQDILGWNMGSLNNDAFEGGIRDLVVYPFALSDAEVVHQNQTGHRYFEFLFDEAPASDKIYDPNHPFRRASCNYTGIIEPCPNTGLPSLSNQGLLFTPQPPADRNQIFRLNGVAGDYGFGTSAWEDTNGFVDTSFTLMAWVNGSTWAGTRDVLAFSDFDYPQKKAGFGIKDNHPYIGGYDNNTNSFNVYSATTTLNTNQWYHLAWQRDKQAGEVRIFVNGVLVLTQPASTFIVPSRTTGILGGDNLMDGFQSYLGQLEHLVFTNRVMTTAQIQAVMGEIPKLNLHLDEDVPNGLFTNNGTGVISASCTNCPTVGAHGQMREAPIFADGQTIALSGAGLSELNNPNYTIALWVQPTHTLAQTQRLWQHDGMELSLTNGLAISFCDGSTQTTISSNSLGLNRWNHVAVVYNNNSPTLYLNGSLDTASTVQAVAGNCTSTSSQIGGSFVGHLDEFAFYSYPLADRQISQQYDYQARWFDARIRPTVLVDKDPPMMQTNLPITYTNADSAKTFVFTAIDAGIGLDRQFNWRMRKPDTYFHNLWTDIGQTTNTLHTYTFPDNFVWQHGQYYVFANMQDQFFNSTVYTHTFWVDRYAPTASVTGGVVLPNGRLQLTGTIDDPDSGLVNHSVRIQLEKNGVAVTDPLQATLTGNQWQAIASLTNIPYGIYDVRVLAYDAVDNLLDSVVGNVAFNERAPTGNLILATDVISSGNKTLYGIVHTLQHPFGAQAYFPFESPTPLVDASGQRLTASCNSCPVVVSNGRFGSALSFNSTHHIDVTKTTTNTEGALLMWIQPTWINGNNGFNPTLATLGNATIQIADNQQSLIINDGLTSHTIPFAMSKDNWHHIGLVSNGTTWTVYGDGQPLQTIASTRSLAFPMSLGANSQGFIGIIDDLLVYDKTILAEAIYDLAHPLDRNISQAQLNLHSLETGTDSWRPLTLNQTNNNYATWSYTIPDQAEGTYQVSLSLTDTTGINATVASVWRGLIDTLPPRISLTSSTASPTEINITCNASDQYLDEASWSCTGASALTKTYETGSWFVQTFSNTQHLIGLDTGPHTIPAQNITLTACDAVGQCSTETITAPGEGGLGTIPLIDTYALVYQLDIPDNANYSGALPTYVINNSAQIGGFDRVAYYLELDDGNNKQWVYASMDAFTNDATQIGVPVATIFEQTVSNLHVLSNVPNVTTGGPFTQGNLEFWHHCYDVPANSGLGGSSSSFDFDDTYTAGSPNCYGSMQLHHAGVGETLFAWNNWDGAGMDDIGIGTQSTGQPDWTYSANANTYLTKTLYVLARPTATANNDTYNVIPGVPLVVNSASGVLANDPAYMNNATLVTPPTRGTVTLQPDGSFTYNLTDMGGNDSFTYEVTDGHYLKAQATVTIQNNNNHCLIETTGDNTLDAYSADASALQNAIQTASPGTTIRVAGKCAGVSGNQVLSITKQITLDGGRNPVDWLAPAQPDVYQATIDAQNAGQAIHITAQGNLTAEGLNIVNGFSDYWQDRSSAIHNEGHLTLQHSTIANNTKLISGGALYNQGVLTMTHTILESNQSATGSIYNVGRAYVDQTLIAGNTDGNGIYNEDSTFYQYPGILFLTNSVIRNNLGGSALSNYGFATIDNSAFINNEDNINAGGIHNRDHITVTNSTISGNRNTNNYHEGGSGFENYGFATIRYSTIVSNTAPNSAGITGIHGQYDIDYTWQGMAMEGTVITYNGNAECSSRTFLGFDQIPQNDYTFSVTGSHNFAEDSSCDVNNFTVGNPLLAPLPSLIGNTSAEMVHLPFMNSPLIDTIPIGMARCQMIITNDQRVISRAQNGLCDIGAVEYANLVLSGSVLGTGMVNLQWSNTNHTSYQLWGSALPYGAMSYINATVTPTTEVNHTPNYYYEVHGTFNRHSMETSNRIGVFTFSITPGD